jgi:type I restriction enzyme S subunit
VVCFQQNGKRFFGYFSKVGDMMEGFQNTDIGLVPDDWDYGRIDDYFTIQQGKSVSKANRIGDNQKPFLRTSNLLWGKVKLEDIDFLHFSKEEELKFKLQYNDLLVCEGGDIGRTAIWKNEMDDIYYQNHLHRVRAKVEDIDPVFVLFWMQYAFQYGKIYFGRANITTIPNLSKSRLSEFTIPKPPLHEQRKIAYILSTVQKAIEQQDKLIRTTTELKKALMQKLFTEGTRGEKQKMTEIGLVPESWEVVKFGEIAEFKNGVNFSKEQKGEKGILTIDVKNMYGKAYTIDTTGLYRVDKDFGDDYTLKNGDLLFVRSSLKLEGVGWTSMFIEQDEPVTYCGFVIRARIVDNAFYSPFLTYYFRTEQARNMLISGSGKVAITNINQGVLNSSLVPKPSLKEQKEIIRQILLVEHKIDNHQKKKSTLTALFKTLLHELMTGQRRVHEIDFRGLSVAEAPDKAYKVEEQPLSLAAEPVENFKNKQNIEK